MPDLIPDITEQAVEPIASASDGQSSTGRSLTEMIAADKYLKTAAALTGPNPNGGPRSGWGALRIAKAIPPGAV